MAIQITELYMRSNLLRTLTAAKPGEFLPELVGIKKEENEPTNLEGRTFEFKPFLREGESYIPNHSYEELRRRAIELNGYMGFREAEWLLDNQDRIPEEFQVQDEDEQNYIVFPGGMIVDPDWKDPGYPDGLVTVLMIHWNNGEYVFTLRGREWCERGRFLVPND